MRAEVARYLAERFCPRGRNIRMGGQCRINERSLAPLSAGELLSGSYH